MDLLKELAGAKRIGISGHIRPDGDCVGSCLALKKYIENAMPEAEVKLYIEQPPVIFSFLYGYDTIDSTYGGISKKVIKSIFSAKRHGTNFRAFFFVFLLPVYEIWLVVY